MRPVNKALFTTNKATYNPYGDSKDDLILALGSYCSYCERYGYSSALDVEHINDKANHPLQEFDWNNFLLACKNCNPTKGTTEIGTSFMPHIDNTFIIFTYSESGFITINTEITDSLNITDKAKQLLDLVGLDRVPGHPDLSKKDKRWQERKKVWEIATEFLKEYKNGDSSLNAIVELALANGFWSIWMNIFSEYDEVKQKLINSFKGTRKEYFID